MKVEISFFANGIPMNVSIEGDAQDISGATDLFRWLSEEAAHAPTRREHEMRLHANLEVPKR